MRNGILGSMTALLAGAGLALAQPPAMPAPAPTAQPGVMVGNPAPAMAQPMSGPVQGPGIVNYGPGTVVEGAGSPCCGGGCGDGGCGDCNRVCGPWGCGWVSAEYIHWWTKGAHNPPLATLNPSGAAPIIGTPGTQIIYGDHSDDNESRSGARVTAGCWFGQYQDFGAEVSWFMLGSLSSHWSAASSGAPGSPSLGVPFLDVTTNPCFGTESVFPVASPGIATGCIFVTSNSRMWGGDGDFLINACCGPNHRIDVIGGFRYLQLNEGLGIATETLLLPGVPGIGLNNLMTNDQFDADNRFFGGDVGLKSEWRFGRVFTTLKTRIAFGATHEIVNIAGTTVLTSPTHDGFAGAGHLALPSNSGRYTRDTFSVVPEVGLNVGVQLMKCLRAYVGYDVLYWSHVVRPGDHIDREINTTQVPTSGSPFFGVARPAFAWNDTGFWAQGVNLGLEFRF